MVALSAIPRWTIEQYLEMERSSSVRHEYLDGYVYALAGGTQAHSVITINVAARLRTLVRGGSCRVYSADMKVRVAEQRFLYPDVSVGCDVTDRHDTADWIAAPRVIVEVLSPSTADYDRGDKFALYRQIPAVQDYVLVETERCGVEVRSRQGDGVWTTRSCRPGDDVMLPSLSVQFAVADCYEDVDVPPA